MGTCRKRKRRRTKTKSTDSFKRTKNKPTFGSVTSLTLDVIFIGRIGIKLFKIYYRNKTVVDFVVKRLAR